MCRYVRIRSITLRCNNVSLASKAFCYSSVLVFRGRTSSDRLSAHLQLTTKDSDLLTCTKPHLLYDRLTTEEGKDDSRT